MARPWSLRDIDLTTLRLFSAVVEEGTLARAAEREHIAISAISRRISDLEELSGVILLERHDRGVQPTVAGEMLFSRTRTLLDLLEQTIIDMEAVRGGMQGLIRLHVHATAISGVLPAKISSFLSLYPGINIEINEHTSREVIHAVRTGIADIGFVSGTVQADELRFFPWQKDEFVVLLPKGHALTKKPRIELADLLGEPFIGMQRDSALMVLCRERAALSGRKLEERAHSTSFQSVRTMVSAGLGVSILPSSAAHPLKADLAVEVRRLDESWAQRPLMLCVRNPNKLSAATRRLIHHLQSDCADISEADLLLSS